MDLSRRALLSGAASATLVGCGKRRTSGPIEARFVGSDPARAHRLRDRDLPPPSATHGETRRTPVLIVGGGAAGMAAAWRLHRAGVSDFVMVELEPEAGGTARGGELPRSPYPMGAHYLPAPHADNRGLWTLLGDLGFVVGQNEAGPELDPRIICRAPVERHKAGGLWSPGLYPARGQSADEEAQWERWREHLRELDGRRGSDGRRLFDLPLDRSSEELRHLDSITMAAYLDRLGLTSERLRWTVDYACRDDYGCTLEQTSAFAALHHELSRGLEDTHDRFIIAFPEGNARLIAAMADAAQVGEALRTDHLVHRIDPDTGVVDVFDLAAERPLRVQAEVILWAAPRFVLRHVVPEGTDRLPPGTMTYAPWLVASVQVRETPGGVGALPAWDNVQVGAPHLGYVRANHHENLTEAGTPGAVLTFYEPRPAPDAAGLTEARTALLRPSLAEHTEHVVAALEGMHPTIRPDIERVDIARWGHAMVRPRPGWLFSADRALAQAPIGRVIPCAADVGGLPLFEEAFASGVRGAETALTRLGRGAATVL